MSADPRRPAVTVAVLGDGDKRHARDLLSRLSPELRRGDDVVLLGPRVDGTTPGAWRHHAGGAELVRLDRTPTLHELVLVLDERVTPCEELLETLTGLMCDPAVAAVGARSNVADGPELLVGVPYAPGDVGARRGFLRARGRRGICREVDHLGGPAVLLRRALLERVGGLAALPGGTGLSDAVQASRRDGGRLLVAEGAYVHHPGGPSCLVRGDWPFLSACLIVKDEEDQLAACLASASTIADEIVVYDTGSTDGTVELARSLGARVLEGDWNGDFGRARNASLESCRGQWVLWIDADEILTCDDPAALRDRLAATSWEVEGYLLLIDNLQGTEASTTLSHPAARLFRRAACRWEGRLHEQIVRRLDGSPPRLQLLKDARIIHRGYLQSALQERSKGERNLRSAFDDLADGSQLPLATRVVSLARSYLLTGRVEEGADLAKRALVLDPHPTIRRLAFRTLAESSLALGDYDEAIEIAERFRKSSKVHALADSIEGRAHLAAGRPEAALSAFDRLRATVVDDDGFELRPSLVAVDRARALIALERHGDAADVLLATLRAEGGIDAHLGLLVECLEQAGRDLSEILQALPRERITAFFPPLLQLQPEVGDRVLERWHALSPSLPLLATAAQLATRLPIDRQLVWSGRLRQAGVAHACPLLANAARSDTDPDARLLGTAVAWATFQDERALAVLGPAALAVSAELRPAIGEAMFAIAPDLAGRLQLLWAFAAPTTGSSAGTTPPRPTGDAPVETWTSLVIARRAAAPEALALARGRTATGGVVLLAQPDPDATVLAALAAEGITVHGWHEERPAAWREEALGAIACCAADRPIDEVILCTGTEPLAGQVAAVLPAAVVRTAAEAADTWAEAAWPTTPVPLDARAGICVAIATRSLSEASFHRLSTGLSALAAARPHVGLLHLGDDAGGRLQATVPSILAAGPVVDVDPYLASAKVVLTLDDDHDGDLLSARARQLGTHVVRFAASEATVTPADFTDVLDSLDATTLPLAPIEDAFTPAPPRFRAASLCRASVPSAARVAGAQRLEATSERETTPVVLRLLGDAPPRHGDGEAAALADLLVDEFGGRLPQRGAPSHNQAAVPGALEVWLDLPASPAELLAGESERAHRVVVLPSHFVTGPPLSWVGVLRDHVDECWASSPAARDVAIERGLPASKVHVVPPVLDGGIFRPDGPVRPLTGIDGPTVVCCGPPTLGSGMDALLEVWLSRPSRPPDATLVVQLLVAPPGEPSAPWLEAALRRLAKEGRHRIVLLDPPRDDLELAALMRAADLVVHPRRADHSGRLVGAAQACGVAVVATDAIIDGLVDDTTGWKVPSMPRVVPAGYAGGWNGASWAEPSRAGISQALRDALEDPHAREARASAGYARARRALGARATLAAVRARLDVLLPTRRPCDELADDLHKKEPA